MANKKMLYFSLLQSKQANYRIFGMSRKGTQLVENGNFESKSGWDAIRSTLNVSNNIAKLTINELTSVGNGNRIVRTVRDLVVGHKYLARYYVKSPKNAEISIQFYQSRYVLDNSTNVVANTRTLMSGIFTAEAVSGTIYLAIKDSLRDNFSVGDTVEFDIAMVNDLTQDFGAGNEPTTVEEALEYYPKPYMAYTGQKGTIINAGGECVAEDENGNQKHFTLPPLRGIGDLKDSIETATGNTQRKFSEVDLGTLSWTYNTNYAYFYSERISTIKKVLANTDTPNDICSNYTIVSRQQWDGTNYTLVQIANDDRVYIKDSDYTNATDFKNGNTGVKLVYELATYTTEQNPSFGLGKGITRITDQNGYELEFEEIEIV